LPSVPKIARDHPYTLKVIKIVASSMIIIATMALAMRTVKEELSIEKVMPFMTTLIMDL
jgi:hypothetical protein